jgi:hypothetical protein
VSDCKICKEIGYYWEFGDEYLGECYCYKCYLKRCQETFNQMCWVGNLK